jgi:hypothetical protein
VVEHLPRKSKALSSTTSTVPPLEKNKTNLKLAKIKITLFSVAEHLPSIYQALGSIPNSGKTKNMWKGEERQSNQGLPPLTWD